MPKKKKSEKCLKKIKKEFFNIREHYFSKYYPFLDIIVSIFVVRFKLHVGNHSRNKSRKGQCLVNMVGRVELCHIMPIIMKSIVISHDDFVPHFRTFLVELYRTHHFHNVETHTHTFLCSP